MRSSIDARERRSIVAGRRGRRSALVGFALVTAVDPEAGILEAFDLTTFFRFEDDVVVRVRPSGGGSVVDVRSLSLYRANDLRANAERIRAFQARLRDRVAP